MPGILVLVIALLAGHPAQEQLKLEIRTYRGSEDVSAATRVIVHRAGQREKPVGQMSRGSKRTISVAPGVYDAQAIHEERDGKVLNIRWVERLVVMPYPDEGGHHLEVINFMNGFGALQIRWAGNGGPGPNTDVALFTADEHSQPAAVPTTPGPYALFVVRAGQYDVLVRRGTAVTWYQGIDVPLDRTRLWIVP
jgi:hypothetical protein